MLHWPCVIVSSNCSRKFIKNLQDLSPRETDETRKQKKPDASAKTSLVNLHRSKELLSAAGEDITTNHHNITNKPHKTSSFSASHSQFTPTPNCIMLFWFPINKWHPSRSKRWKNCMTSNRNTGENIYFPVLHVGSLYSSEHRWCNSSMMKNLMWHNSLVQCFKGGKTR